MEECSVDLIFFSFGTARPFGFLVGERLFFQQLKLDSFRQSESIYFCNNKNKSKKGGKDQESIQSSFAPDPGYHREK